MATSGTTTFNPSLGSMALSAFSRCQVKRTELTQQHMDDVFMESNLLQADWSADGILWWTVELITETLVAGTAQYSVPLNVVSVLDVYISPNSGTTGQNRLITAFSRTDYASLADPTQQGFPTSFWYDRTIPASLNLWPTPDSSTTYQMSYYAYKQPEDAQLRIGAQVEMPYWWLNAYVADLAHRLSRIYAPTLEGVRKADRDEAYARACKQTEPSPLYITPGLSGYYRS